MSVLNNVIVICLEVHIWSGRKKLREEDLMKTTTSGKLPPETLVSLGAWKTFDPQALKPFADIKRAAEVACRAVGTPFLRGFAIPKDEFPGIAAQLNKLQKEFGDVREQFLSTFEVDRARWISQYPEYEKILEGTMISKDAVQARLSFGFRPFQVNGVEDELAQLVEDGGADLAVGIAGQLMLDIAADARDLVKRSLVGRSEVTQKFLRPIRAIREKLSGLAFLDGSIQPVIDEIDRVLAAMPTRGKIDGVQLAALRGLCATLSNASDFLKHGQLLVLPKIDDDTEIDEGEESSTSEQSPVSQPVTVPPPAVVTVPTETASEAYVLF